MYWTPLILFSLPFIILSPLAFSILSPYVLRAFGSVLGWYLRKKTEGRRTRILEVMEEDERSYRGGKGGSKSLDGADWVSVGASAGNSGEKQWAGIVGFFHPFW